MSKPLQRALALAALAAACSAGAEPVNLIVNGDFEAGATGFGTDYRLSSSGCIGCVGVATTTTGWYNAPGFVHSFNDHSTGSGQMLQWDPPSSNGPGQRIWFQSVAVTAGQTYSFSGWVREANSEATPNNGRLAAYVDGVLLGTQDALDHVWSSWSFNWTAAQTGSVQLALRDLYPTTFFGTYSALDDLAFRAVAAAGPTVVPEPASLALVALGLAGLALRPRRPA